MIGAIIRGLMWLFGLLTKKPAGPSPEAAQAGKAAAAETRATGEDNALAELKTADAARAAAERVSLHDAGTGAATTDPGAAINSVDTEDRRD